MREILPAMIAVLALCGEAWAQGAGEAAASGQPPYEVVAPPACVNDKGEPVRFEDRDGGRADLAAGMAARDGDGEPVVYRSNYSATPPDFQRFIDFHECAHHQTGDVDRPHPPRNGPEHLMNESISDCVAILRLRDEEGYGRAGFERVAAAMRADMERIGFPEISVSSRIANIETCFARDGSAEDFIEVVRERRGEGK
ncbi:hypothetical protein [Oricola cellulosilytica]|uniref:Uncharacterized protein n=1 Tax=Oricola cellulosilytica TaxID=1429082 RepID=A0A4R0PC71_9HYPH|nr:hypothetical protein [Oricola cellulosilytica]TCD14123.1 hypothetical protein E0D97_08490 [Oricola cellulosilytica]